MKSMGYSLVPKLTRKEKFKPKVKEDILKREDREEKKYNELLYDITFFHKKKKKKLKQLELPKPSFNFFFTWNVFYQNFKKKNRIKILRRKRRLKAKLFKRSLRIEKKSVLRIWYKYKKNPRSVLKQFYFTRYFNYLRRRVYKKKKHRISPRNTLTSQLNFYFSNRIKNKLFRDKKLFFNEKPFCTLPEMDLKPSNLDVVISPFLPKSMNSYFKDTENQILENVVWQLAKKAKFVVLIEEIVTKYKSDAASVSEKQLADSEIIIQNIKKNNENISENSNTVDGINNTPLNTNQNEIVVFTLEDSDQTKFKLISDSNSGIKINLITGERLFFVKRSVTTCTLVIKYKRKKTRKNWNPLPKIKKMKVTENAADAIRHVRVIQKKNRKVFKHKRKLKYLNNLTNKNAKFYLKEQSIFQIKKKKKKSKIKINKLSLLSEKNYKILYQNNFFFKLLKLEQTALDDFYLTFFQTPSNFHLLLPEFVELEKFSTDTHVLNLQKNSSLLNF